MVALAGVDGFVLLFVYVLLFLVMRMFDKEEERKD